VFAPDGALDALLKLKADGKIRAIGLGARPHDMHRACIENGNFDLSLTFGDYNLLNQSASQTILPLAAAHGVGVFNAMVVEYGLLTGQDPHEVAKERRWNANQVKVEHAYKLWNWAKAENYDLLALALQYSARDPRVSAILVGASQPSEIDVDLQAYTQPFADSVWTALQSQFHTA